MIIAFSCDGVRGGNDFHKLACYIPLLVEIPHPPFLLLLGALLTLLSLLGGRLGGRQRLGALVLDQLPPLLGGRRRPSRADRRRDHVPEAAAIAGRGLDVLRVEAPQRRVLVRRPLPAKALAPPLLLRLIAASWAMLPDNRSPRSSWLIF